VAYFKGKYIINKSTIIKFTFFIKEIFDEVS